MICEGGGKEISMHLTIEQKQAIDDGEAVRVQTDAGALVVVKAEVYDMLVGMFSQETEPQEAYPAVLEAWDSVGSPDDATDYL
jgi:hypothetical protein